MYCKYSTQNLDSTVYPEYKFETNNSIIELVYVDANKAANCFKSGHNTRRYYSVESYNVDNTFITATEAQ